MAGDITMGNPLGTSSTVAAQEIERGFSVPETPQPSLDGMLFNSSLNHPAPAVEERPASAQDLRNSEPINHLAAAVETQFGYAGLNGVNTRPVEVFSSSDFKRNAGLQHAREEISHLLPEESRNAVSEIAQPAVSSERTAVTTYAEKRRRTLEELRQDIRLEARKTGQNAAGRVQTLGLHTEQKSSEPEASTGTLLRVIRLTLQRQKNIAISLQNERQRAKQIRKGPGSILEGGKDSGRVDMAEMMKHVEPAELTIGE
jgi:hypothetical protein